MNTRCLDTLKWFIGKSKKDNWTLIYDDKISLDTFGIIDYYNEGYKFLPVLHGGLKVYGVIVKN